MVFLVCVYVCLVIEVINCVVNFIQFFPLWLLLISIYIWVCLWTLFCLSVYLFDHVCANTTLRIPVGLKYILIQGESPLFFWYFFLAIFVPFFHMNLVIRVSYWYFMKNLVGIYITVLCWISRLIGRASATDF